MNKKYKQKLHKIGLAANVLLALCEDIGSMASGTNLFDSRKAIYKYARKLNMGETQFDKALQTLRRDGYIQKSKSEEGGNYLITPRGIKHAKMLDLQKEVKLPLNWNGQWKIVIFDIPETKKKERNIFRSYLKRKKFIHLQNSVFICPFANFDELNLIRHELKIAKYVNFLEGKSATLDDDSVLKKHFNLP